MSNNSNGAAQKSLPYFLANYQGRSVAIKRDADYQAGGLTHNTDPSALRIADPQDVTLSTLFSDYGDIEAQISEEIWSDVVSDVKTIEIALEGLNIPEDLPPHPIGVQALTFKPSAIGTVACNAPTPNGCRDPSKSSLEHTGPISINLRTTYRGLISLNGLPESTKVKELKRNVEDVYGTPVALQQLVLCGVPLNDQMELKQIVAVEGEPVDLVLGTRKSTIYVLPAYDRSTGELIPLRGVNIQLSVNRKWECSAFQTAGHALGNHMESRSLAFNVWNESTLFDEERQSEVYWLQWDGRLSHPADSYRSTLAIEYNNSVAVPFEDAEQYIRSIFDSLHITRRELLSQFLSHLNSNKCSYLAIRFLSQADYQKTAVLSIPGQRDAQVIHVVLLYKSLAPESVPLWNSAPPHLDDAAAAWQDKVDPGKILKIEAANRYKPVVVDFTFLEVP
ncbi:ubiquitin family protein [Ceratobasidium sp. AG-Ba]|nr:ubiquitin family protein [Ceratobasidium sp. AG-Ba]